MRSATFPRDLLLVLFNPYHIISAVTALQAAAQHEVAFVFFVPCVIGIDLSIDMFVLFIWSPRLLLPASSGVCPVVSSQVNVAVLSAAPPFPTPCTAVAASCRKHPMAVVGIRRSELPRLDHPPVLPSTLKPTASVRLRSSNTFGSLRLRSRT